MLLTSHGSPTTTIQMQCLWTPSAGDAVQSADMSFQQAVHLAVMGWSQVALLAGRKHSVRHCSPSVHEAHITYTSLGDPPPPSGGCPPCTPPSHVAPAWCGISWLDLHMQERWGRLSMPQKASALLLWLSLQPGNGLLLCCCCWTCS